MGVLRYLADLSEKDGDLDTALARHQECLRLRESHAALGHVYVRRGDAASALQHLEQALTNAEAHQDWLTVADVQLGMARAHALRGVKARVEEWLRRAWALATERGLSVIFEEVEQLGREHGVALR